MANRITGQAGTTREVEFAAGSLMLRGTLRLPDTEQLAPIVILAHGFGGLKEWTIPEIADRLVESGIIAMSFDYRNFGDSDGSPRDEVDRHGQLEDWRSAVTFASMLPETDGDRIGIWGTSFGGRNVLVTAALDRRVACVVAQVPATTQAARGYLAIADGDDEKYRKMMAEDRRDRAEGKEPRYISYEDPRLGTAHLEYWDTFGEAERRNFNVRVSLRSYEQALGEDLRPLMSRIAPTPLRMLLADKDVGCPTSEQLEAYLLAGEPKSLTVFPGHHYSLYTKWKEQAIGLSVDWFVEHLEPTPRDS